MATISGENLNPASWQQSERQAVLDEIIAVGDVVLPNQAVDYASMTDVELEAAMTAVINEVDVRPSTVHTVMDSLEFNGTTIVRQQP